MTAAQMQKISIAVLIPLLSILILNGIANAQPAPTATGALRGAVNTAAPDGQSYNVPGASLNLKTPTWTPEAATDDAGEYQFTNLLPGAYSLKANVQGFKAASKIVTIRAGETSVETISLEVVDISATVTGASSTSGQGVQTTETAPSTSLKQNDLHNYATSLASSQNAPASATSAQQETNNDTFKDPAARVFELVLTTVTLKVSALRHLYAFLYFCFIVQWSAAQIGSISK